MIRKFSNSNARNDKRFGRFLYSGLFTGAVAVGYFFNKFSFQRTDVPIQQSKESEAGRKYLDKLQKKLNNIDLVKKLENDPRYIESKAWRYAYESHNESRCMTTGILSTIGGLSIAPRVFVDIENQSLIAVIHYGHLLTGLLFFAHGGILGTLLDDALARTAGLSLLAPTDKKLPEHTSYGNTKQLSLTYKKPVVVDQFLVIRSSIVASYGKIVEVQGSIRNLDNKELVTATGEIIVRRSWWPFF